MSKISTYPAAAVPLTGTELLYAVQGGADTKVTAAQIAALAPAPTVTLAGDTDVALTTPTDTQVLTYDGATSKWKNKSLPAVVSGSTTLAGDTDVAIAGVSDGNVLTYDAVTTKWKNKAPAAGGGGSSTLALLTDVSTAGQTPGSILTFTPSPGSSYDAKILAIPSLIHYYPMNDTTSTIKDYKGTANLSLGGSYVLSAASLLGDNQASIRFTGGEAVSSTGILPTSGPITFETWGSLETASGFQAIWSTVSQSLSLYSNDIHNLGANPNAGPLSGTNVTGPLHHFVMVYDGARTITGYLDGNLVGTYTAGAQIVISATDPFLIGALSGAGANAWNGRLAKMAIYALGFDVTAIRSNYNAGTTASPYGGGTGPKYSFTAPSTSGTLGTSGGVTDTKLTFTAPVYAGLVTTPDANGAYTISGTSTIYNLDADQTFKAGLDKTLIIECIWSYPNYTSNATNVIGIYFSTNHNQSFGTGTTRNGALLSNYNGSDGQLRVGYDFANRVADSQNTILGQSQTTFRQVLKITPLSTNRALIECQTGDRFFTYEYQDSSANGDWTGPLYAGFETEANNNAYIIHRLTARVENRTTNASTSTSTSSSVTPTLYYPDIVPASSSTFDDEFNGSTLSSKWTIFNSTPANTLRTATVDPNYGQVILDSPYATGDRAFLISQPAPTTPFTLTAKMGRINGSGNYSGPMLWLSGTGNARYSFGSLYNSGNGGPVTYSLILNADQSVYQDNKVPNYEINPSSSGYYRLVYRSATSVDYHYSTTGKFNGSTLVGTVDTSPLGPLGTIGVGMHPYGIACSIYCDWFRVTTP